MMEESRKSAIPVWAIILDVIGTLILVVGILAQFGAAGGLLPDTAEMRAIGAVLIFAGVLLMVPLIAVVIRRAISANR